MTQPYLSQRILTFFALGGVSIAVVAFWFLEHRRKANKSLKEAPASKDMAVKEDEPAVAEKSEQQSYAVSDTDTSDIEDATEKTEEIAPPKPSVPEVQETLAVSSDKSVEDLTNGHDHPSFNWAEDVERAELQRTAEQQLEAESSYRNGDDKNADAPTVSVQNPASSAIEYESAESPSTNSTNSEASADSGRATGGPASYSPFDLDMTHPRPPTYEFEIPNTLVGLIIGVKGKTIRELCTRADVKMLIRPHHTPEKFDTHQICTVQGKRENVNKCLHMIRLRFPPNRFPDLNLKPVLPPPVATAVATNYRAEPAILSLPVGVPCEVYISAPVDAGHFFVQLPTHPSFSHLQRLDYYMLNVYSQVTGAPELPKPCNPGVLCAAPAYNGWFRAITLLYDESQDEMLVRFVDYGGFARIPRADLRQIRTDFMTLPFQAIECYLAHVQPVDGTSHWSDEANELFQSLCMSKIIQAEIVGHNKHDNVAYVELYVLDDDKNVVRVDQSLLEKGLAKPIDPSKVVDLPTHQKIAAEASAAAHQKEKVEDAVEKEAQEEPSQ
ncbi:Protein C56G2.1 a [Aphelenchoides avenae]|nr:Protein C56G2.1 a [Aphelenchus avenae]